MLAVVPIRNGVIPAGGAETIAECDGAVLLAGSGTDRIDPTGLARRATLLELGSFAAGRWAAAIAAAVDAIDPGATIVLPGSPDGRDLGPRLAVELDRPFFAGAIEIAPGRITRPAHGPGEEHELHDHDVAVPFVATLQPGVRDETTFDAPPETSHLDPPPPPERHDAVSVELLPPDVHTMDLSEASRIVGGGAGLDDRARFERLDDFATAIGAVMGATRVITDRGWLRHDKQIGTTGVHVDPGLYVSFGVSGAVQHTAGLGTPDHVISVNVDPHCPMMTMSDLAIVSDANATLDALCALLAPGPAPVDGLTATVGTPEEVAADD